MTIGALSSSGEAWADRIRSRGGFEASDAILHEAAIERAVHEDFGPGDYRTGLSVLLRSLDENIETALPRAESVGDLIVTALASRLHVQAGWKARPDSLEKRLVAPLFIAGIPRSGTTALHRLMSMDPQFQGMERWIGRAPRVRPPRDEWERFPTFAAALREVAGRDGAAQRAHRIAAEEVDECLIPMAPSFVTNWFGSQLDVPDYDRWFLDQDETPSYRRYADILRLVGADDDRRWLLKNPSHTLGIDALLNAFPDAMVVQTHRNPTETIASLSNLLANILDANAEERVRISRRNLKIWHVAVQRMMAVQDRKPGQVFNVDFRTFLAGPMETVRAIYTHFGLELGGQAEANMRSWIADNPQNKHGAHHYSLAAAKLGHDEVRDTFADYIDRYRLQEAA